MRVLNENSEYTQGDFGRVVDIPYKVIGGISLESDEYYDMASEEDFDSENFMNEHQKAIEDKLSELGYEYSGKPVVIRYLDKMDDLYIDEIEEAVQYLALKDGADLVEFEDGNIGFVGYYNDYKNNAFEILRNATRKDLYASDNDIELEENPEDYGFELPRYELLKRKYINDEDGFQTEYSLYQDFDEDRYVCVFGDSDIYTPEDGEFDAEFESEDEAYEWFDDYNGFEDEDEDSYR